LQGVAAGLKELACEGGCRISVTRSDGLSAIAVVLHRSAHSLERTGHSGSVSSLLKVDRGTNGRRGFGGSYLYP